jgi:hypothetical protein
MEDLSYLNTEYTRRKSIESYEKEAKLSTNCTCGDPTHHGSEFHKQLTNDINKEEKQMKRQFFIAGVQFRPRAEINEASKKIQVGDTLVLEPEPTNRFDPNAVKILSGGGFLGYVPKKFSSEVSAMLGIGAPIVCTVDEVNAAAKTYEMFKVTISIPVEEEDNGTFEDHEGESER